MIRLTIPSIEEDDLIAVQEVLRSGFLVQGKHVEAFEHAIAEYVGSEHAVAVSNCTAALHLALLAIGVGPGDRVAVATYSWPATANVIVLVGAEPVFVDIDQGTFNMCPEALELVLKREAIKAVLPVHTFGGAANLPRIVELCTRFGISLIEDAACALGTELNGKKAGTWGALGCFSFHPRKAITTGEGGMVITADQSLAKKIRILRNHGLNPDAGAPEFVEAGYNLRLTEFQAALGLSQLRKLERIIARRRDAAAVYDKLFEKTDIQPPAFLKESRHVYQSYVCLLPRSVAPQRRKIIDAMKKSGVEINIGTYHMPLTTFYAKRGSYRENDFPVSDDISTRAVSLPLYESIKPHEQRLVSELLLQISTIG